MKEPREYQTWHHGEWENVRMKKFKLMCCDCKLVHEVTFKKVNRGILMRMKRDDRATSAARRKRNG